MWGGECGVGGVVRECETRVQESGDETRWSLREFVGERVDLSMSFVFSFSLSGGEAGVRKTAVSTIAPSVKDPQKDFLGRIFWGK
jgi:hypothetical protein